MAAAAGFRGAAKLTVTDPCCAAREVLLLSLDEQHLRTKHYSYHSHTQPFENKLCLAACEVLLSLHEQRLRTKYYSSLWSREEAQRNNLSVCLNNGSPTNLQARKHVAFCTAIQYGACFVLLLKSFT